VDDRSAAALRARGIPPGRSGQAVPAADFEDRDLVVALDAGHERALRAMAETAADRAKIRMLRSYDPAAADDRTGSTCRIPYYGGERGFEHVLDSGRGGLRRVAGEVEAELWIHPSG
jgi:protein-tyrosine phosphatase